MTTPNDTSPVTPPVEPPANPPTVPVAPEATSSIPNSTSHTDTNSRMDRLENIVTSLTETVSRLIPSDDRPVKRPWTHAGTRKRGE